MDLKNIAIELGLKEEQVQAVLNLLEQGNTVPFIARYRKEMTQGMDEEQILSVSEKYKYQSHLEKRKEDVARLIEKLGKLTPEIEEDLKKCTKLSQVEDIYRPYQQKKKTRAGVAISYGLEPLCQYLLTCKDENLEMEAKKYLNENVDSVEMALQGACDILAEKVSEDKRIREKLYDSMMRYGRVKTALKKNQKDEMKVYRMYYDYKSLVSRIGNHNIMAIDRGEREKILSCEIEFDRQYSIQFAQKLYHNFYSKICSEYVEKAVVDGLNRLAIPSVENQVRSELSERAQKASIEVFSMNLEKLLLQPPLKDKVILGFDPAFRTGCKLAVIDESGKMLEVSVIYPHEPNAQVEKSRKELKRLIDTYHIQVIAIGNGTASRESEQFVADFISDYHLDVEFTIVSEAGASVYSASETARKEYPDLTVEKRSAISIARRLMDPLCELIKIDPQSIGVGQYQHDLPQKQLKERLEFVVKKVVNRVGVNVNTASVELLKKVSGLNASSAKSIVDYREAKGKIKNRKEILSIPKIGNKSYEQAAGFLRVLDSDNALDQTAIHPESYEICEELLREMNLSMDDLGGEHLREVLEGCHVDELSEKLGCDVYTLEDICDVLKAPLRDYRDSFDKVILRKDLLSMEDLSVNDHLQGTIRNVVDFGAFVDIGLHDDGLVHITQLSKENVTHPSEVVSVGNTVDVWVKKIDMEKQKVQLTMINPNL